MELDVIDTATNAVVRRVALPGPGYGAAVTKDGKWLVVAIPSKNQVAVVDMQTWAVVKTVDVPATPQEVLLRPDGAVAYVSCNTTGKVAVVDTKRWTVVGVVAAGRFADGLGWVR